MSIKIKQFLSITNPEAFLREDYFSCLSLHGYETGVAEWVNIGEIEIEVDISLDVLVKRTLKAFTKEEKRLEEEFNHKMKILNDRRRELQALTYEPLKEVK